jgi:4'-phosphopantetheinyl transferase
MPFIREIMPDIGIYAGTWHITETEEELLALVNLTRPEQVLYNSFRHEQRRRQWLAYRALLRHMLHPGSAEILYDLNGKPFLTSHSHYISVSHAGEFAAAVYAENKPVGIDIEKLRDRIERVKERFMHPRELESLDRENLLGHLYVYWCGKEALYKLYGKPAVDFRNDIYIHPFDYLCNTNQTCRATLTVDGRKEDYSLYFLKTGECMLVIAF